MHISLLFNYGKSKQWHDSLLRNFIYYTRQFLYFSYIYKTKKVIYNEYGEGMKKTRRVSKTAKRRLFILVPVTLVVVTYFFASISYYAYKIYSLKKEEKNLTLQMNDLKEEEDNLKTDIEKLQNPDYLARYARENYHYSKDGELVIQRREETTVEEKKEKETDDNQGLLVICIIGLFIVLLYIVKHKTKKR